MAVLGICALVVLLVSFARWTADTDLNRHFPWITLLATGFVSLGLTFFALRSAGKVVEVKPTPPTAS